MCFQNRSALGRTVAAFRAQITQNRSEQRPPGNKGLLHFLVGEPHGIEDSTSWRTECHLVEVILHFR